MEIVRSVNRSWIYDSYFSLYRPIHPGEMSGGNVRAELSEYPIPLRVGVSLVEFLERTKRRMLKHRTPLEMDT